jgi:DNA-binding transcriptional ArsR family regulator
MNKPQDILKALSDGTRYRILDLLLTHDLCVGALAHHLGLSKAAVSQHLQIMRRAGLVAGEKRGYWTHYSVKREVLRSLAEDIIRLADRHPSPESCCFDASAGQEPCSRGCEFKSSLMELKTMRKEGKEDV